MFELYIALTTIIPLSAVPAVKYGSIVLFSAMGFIARFKSKEQGVRLTPFVASGSVVIFFGMYGLISNNDAEQVLVETASLLAFVVTLFFMFDSYLRSRGVVQCICYSFAIYLILKLFVLLFAARFSPLGSSTEVFFAIREYIPAAVITGFGFGGMPRIVFANDFLVPIFIFWLAFMHAIDRVKTNMASVIGALAITVSLLSLSRYLFVLTFVSIVLSSLLRFRAQTVFVYVVFSIGLIFLVPIMISYFGYEDVINDRFFGQIGASSNALKLEQLSILDYFYSSPLVGQGFGFDLQLAGRELKHVFQSEVQWFGYLAKMGFVGIIFFSYLTFEVSKGLVDGGSRLARKVKFYVSILLFIWLLAGFTNPVLFFTSSTINYLLLFSIVVEVNRRVSYSRHTRR